MNNTPDGGLAEQRGCITGTGAQMSWAVDVSAHWLNIDIGTKFISLDRNEAWLLLEVLNEAIPHMATSGGGK